MAFNLKEYVFHKRAEGLNDKQIATSLGMSLKHLTAKLNEKEEVKVEEKPIDIPTPKKKKEEKAVVEDFFPKEEEILKEYPKSYISE